MRKSQAQIYDELLVIKCQQGDREAFDELVGRWQKRLWHYAFKVTGSESAAWDIVQEIWYGIIKGIRKLEDVSVFPRWAFRIANNKCTDRLRRQQQQQRLNNELTKLTKNDYDRKQNSDEKTESLWAAIGKLSPHSRALLTLRYLEGFDISQIAEILSVPEGTVKSRLHRTLDQLRQIVERYQNG
jgi:RNA polymerase sigma-70 factor (ECF subfamily)